MPTHRDHPWLRDQNTVRTEFDPSDPEAAARLHVARQQQAIDEANQATSVAPPGGIEQRSA